MMTSKEEVEDLKTEGRAENLPSHHP